LNEDVYEVEAENEEQPLNKMHDTGYVHHREGDVIGDADYEVVEVEVDKFDDEDERSRADWTCFGGHAQAAPL
jgi:hypothetical protein